MTDIPMNGDPYPPYYFPAYPQQGWQCPLCQRVHNPNVDLCFFCMPVYKSTVTTAATSEGDEKLRLIDKPNHEAAVKAAVEKAVKDFRERVCQAMFGQCESDNVAQRTVDAIRAIPLESEETNGFS